jgi:hypothetical protein
MAEMAGRGGGKRGKEREAKTKRSWHNRAEEENQILRTGVKHELPGENMNCS